jgi:hypothetical protein
MAKKRPSLKLCAAAWTLTNYPSEKKQWSMDDKVKAAKDAGFDGFSAGAQTEIVEACNKHGLQLVGGVDVATVDEARWNCSKRPAPSTSMCSSATTTPRFPGR